MQADVIYGSGHLRVMHRPGSSAYALVTFNHATSLAEGDHYWCRTMGVRQHISIHQTRESQSALLVNPHTP